MEPKNALVQQYRKYLAWDGVELEFARDALEAIAELALARGTGARALRAIIEEVMLDIMYEVPVPVRDGQVPGDGGGGAAPADAAAGRHARTGGASPRRRRADGGGAERRAS